MIPCILCCFAISNIFNQSTNTYSVLTIYKARTDILLEETDTSFLFLFYFLASTITAGKFFQSS